MNQSQARIAFGALSQETRLEIIRLLVRAGTEGLSAGNVAAAVHASASNVSFHLKELEHSGLVSARRESRSIIYSASYEALRQLIDFLMKDCCADHAEICAPSTIETSRRSTKAKGRTYA